MPFPFQGFVLLSEGLNLGLEPLNGGREIHHQGSQLAPAQLFDLLSFVHHLVLTPLRAVFKLMPLINYPAGTEVPPVGSGD
jgi:hypothetical protein